jgi:hypothetical protein
MLAEVCPSVVEVSCCTLAQNFILNVFLFDVQEEYQKLVAIDKKNVRGPFCPHTSESVTAQHLERARLRRVKVLASGSWGAVSTWLGA